MIADHLLQQIASRGYIPRYPAEGKRFQILQCRSLLKIVGQVGLHSVTNKL